MNLYMEFSHTSAHVRLDEAKRDLIALMAKEIQARRYVNDFEARIADYAGYVQDALDTGDDSLAQEIAAQIAAMNSKLMLREKTNVSFYAQVNRLKDAVHCLEGRLYDRDDRLQYIQDYLDAEAELADGGGYRELDRKMRAAGIGKHVVTGHEVLERIRVRLGRR